MVDALVLEASTSVCGFESHLPHQKEKGAERCLFLLVPNAARCGGDFRFALCVAGTCGSPTHAPSLFVIPYSLGSKRTAPATGRGLELGRAPGFFLCPKFAPPPAKSKLTALPTGFPKTALPESMPQSGTPKLFTLLYSLFTRPTPAFPSHSLRAPESCSQQGGGGSVPRRQCGTAKRPFPPHGPACRAQAHSEPVPQSGTPKLFTLHSSLFTLPALLLFPSGADSKTKIYFVFWSLDT